MSHLAISCQVTNRWHRVAKLIDLKSVVLYSEPLTWPRNMLETTLVGSAQDLRGNLGATHLFVQALIGVMWLGRLPLPSRGVCNKG